MLVYKPPPLHEVWLDEAGRRQGKEDLLRQRRRNEDLMRSQKRETRKQMGPTPVVASPVEDIVPEGAPISARCHPRQPPKLRSGGNPIRTTLLI